jgi:hypothetical protein
MNESYTLDIPPNGTVTLRAKEVWGALRGLETLAQMIEYEPQAGTYLVRWGPWSIVDAPQLAHRGLLIDTCVHRVCHALVSAVSRIEIIAPAGCLGSDFVRCQSMFGQRTALSASRRNQAANRGSCSYEVQHDSLACGRQCPSHSISSMRFP